MILEYHTLKLYTEWGINLRFNQIKNKLWFNIFTRIAAIFAIFVLVLFLANATFLVNFFTYKQKGQLKEQVLSVATLKLNDTQLVENTLADIKEKYNFDVEIYDITGTVIYSTRSLQKLDSFSSYFPNDRFEMVHEALQTVKQEHIGDGVIFKTAVRAFDREEYLVCFKKINDTTYAEVRIQMQLINNSATAANEFIIIISLVFLSASLVWVFFFARKFSKPISEMSEITKDMANLNFSRKIAVKSRDEIGELAASVNGLSESLSCALEDLKKTNAKLQSEIDLERQLDVMRKGFVANVSHELKTPISIISGYAEGLKLNINPEQQEKYCNTIIDESQRMNKLVLSILELSRYESGQMPINKQSFDISPICSKILERIFGGKNITTENIIPFGTICVADSIQIEQVLKSLLENALCHTPDGGKVTISAELKDRKVRILVENTGNHIDEEIMPQIWQSFYRGDTSHKRDSKRFGLGLSIVAAICKMHSNSCGVYNTENGVCFWFELDLLVE